MMDRRTPCHFVVVLVAFLAAASSTIAPAQQPERTSPLASLLAQGSAAMQRGDLPVAESSFAHAVAAAPARAEAHFGLGLVLLREGAVDRATASLRQAVKLNPKLAGAHLFLGIAQYQVGDLAAALGNMEAELALSPNDVEALTWLGMVALDSNRPELAATSFDLQARSRLGACAQCVGRVLR